MVTDTDGLIKSGLLNDYFTIPNIVICLALIGVMFILGKFLWKILEVDKDYNSVNDKM